MSFQSDLRTLMVGDSSINTMVNNKIYYENLEENYDLTKDWIVYSFRKASEQDCINSKNAFTTYSIYVRILSASTITVSTLSDLIQNYLNHKEQGGIADVWMVNDSHNIDYDKKQYTILLEFGSFYVG